MFEVSNLISLRPLRTLAALRERKRVLTQHPKILCAIAPLRELYSKNHCVMIIPLAVTLTSFSGFVIAAISSFDFFASSA